MLVQSVAASVTVSLSRSRLVIILLSPVREKADILSLKAYGENRAHLEETDQNVGRRKPCPIMKLMKELGISIFINLFTH